MLAFLPLTVYLVLYKVLPERTLLHGLVLLPGTVLLGAAAVLHLRLPPEKKEQVTLSHRLGPVHIYLTFLTFLVLNGTLFADALLPDRLLVNRIGAIGLALLLGSMAVGYLGYFRRKRRKEGDSSGKKRWKEDPWD